MSDAQYRVYMAIKDYIHRRGYSPTVRELCDLTGKSSPATIQAHLVNLKKKGYITFVANKNRTIRILK